MTVTPAGWYPDPQNPAQLRYWDGQAWSESTAPAAPAAPSAPATPVDPAAGQGYGGYPTYPSYGSSYPTGMQNPYAEQKPSNTLSIIGIVCGAIAFLFCPFILGIAGLVLGGVAKSKNEPLANVALIVSGLGLVGGIIISVVVLNSMGV